MLLAIKSPDLFMSLFVKIWILIEIFGWKIKTERSIKKHNVIKKNPKFLKSVFF